MCHSMGGAVNAAMLLWGDIDTSGWPTPSALQNETNQPGPTPDDESGWRPPKSNIKINPDFVPSPDRICPDCGETETHCECYQHI
jgi:hypothetical protein